MPPKKKTQPKKIKNHGIKASQPQKSSAYCFFQSPGPIYQLPPVLGYKNHCHTKYRNPAYSIPEKPAQIGAAHAGPGPIYYPIAPKRQGFSFGKQWKPLNSGVYTPGPYQLPPYKPTPAFSLSSRMKELSPATMKAGPYNIPRNLNGPAFTMGIPFRKAVKIDHGPSLKVINFKWVTPRAPAFSLRLKPRSQGLSNTPGPYNPVDLKKGPAFSMGVKYSPCIFPYITSCDKLC